MDFKKKHQTTNQIFLWSFKWENHGRKSPAIAMDIDSWDFPIFKRFHGKIL